MLAEMWPWSWPKNWSSVWPREWANVAAVHLQLADVAAVAVAAAGSKQQSCDDGCDYGQPAVAAAVAVAAVADSSVAAVAAGVACCCCDSGAIRAGIAGKHDVTIGETKDAHWRLLKFGFCLFFFWLMVFTHIFFWGRVVWQRRGIRWRGIFRFYAIFCFGFCLVYDCFFFIFFFVQ